MNTFIVSYDDKSGDIPVLIIGTKNKNSVEIVNAYQGDEATKIYKSLVTRNKEFDHVSIGLLKK